jgi:ATP-dependent DNA helicase PIF1
MSSSKYTADKGDVLESVESLESLESVESLSLGENGNDNDDNEIRAKLLDLVLNKRRNIFLSGAGGVGKSFLIVNILKQEVDRRNKIMAITSTTGVSALGIGGTTIHRWSGIKLGKESVTSITNNIRDRNKDCMTRWKTCDILVIDEISMLGMKTFLLLDLVARNICGTDLPFGGKQLIVSGDFLQLPPVQDTFAFTSELWKELDFRIFRLTKPKRYPDVDHFNLLMRVRKGNHTKEDVKKMYARCDAYIDYIRKGSGKDEKIKPTRIYSLKKDVEQNNLDELYKLKGNNTVYNSIDRFALKKEGKNGKAGKNGKEGKNAKSKEGKNVKSKEKKSKNAKGEENENENENYSDDDKETCNISNISTIAPISEKDVMDYTEFLDTIVPRQIVIKPGAQLMLTSNLSPEIGLVNGSRCVAISCDIDNVNVLFKNGVVTRISHQLYEVDDGKVKMTRYQLPLILAWACSIHKIQGYTLDYAIMDLGPSIFASGMCYVGLSRVRTLDGLLLSSFEPKKIIADPTALEFEREIEKNEMEQDSEYYGGSKEIRNEGKEIRNEGKEGKEIRNESKEISVTFTSIRGKMRGKKVTVENICGVDKHLVSFIKIDCPEIYEIMDSDMWNRLDGLEVSPHESDSTLYGKLLDLLELEGEEEEVDEEEVDEEEESERESGPVEDLSSEEE